MSRVADCFKHRLNILKFLSFYFPSNPHQNPFRKPRPKLRISRRILIPTILSQFVTTNAAPFGRVYKSALGRQHHSGLANHTAGLVRARVCVDQGGQ